MNDGYGFGAEGDWKTSVMVRAVKVMASGLHGGTSFMEDYTYHFDPAGMKVLGSHMLEVCETIAAGETVAGNSSPGYRWKGRSAPPGLRYAGGAGNQRSLMIWATGSV